jgi:aminoacyl tRNA synthase complex-interacting multifunctional protein 1
VFVQATSKEGKAGGIELVKPPENSKIGDKVYFEGSDYESETVLIPLCITPQYPNTLFVVAPGATPLSQLNPKKKIFETIQPGLTTLDTHEAAWIDPVTKSVQKIRTKDGVCVAPSFVGASLS